MTVGHLPTEPGGMLTETRPARPQTAGPVLWALTSGIAGLVANVLLGRCSSCWRSPSGSVVQSPRRARTSCGLAAPRVMW